MRTRRSNLHGNAFILFYGVAENSIIELTKFMLSIWKR